MLLGSLMERPLHGYLLKTEAFRRVFREFGVNDNHLYPTLKKLEEEGLIRKKAEISEGRPDRHVYSITARGKDAKGPCITLPEGISQNST